MGTVVLDAQPLVALVARENTMSAIRDRIRACSATDDVIISAVNWCEVLYIARRKGDPFLTARAQSLMSRIPVAVVGVGPELASHAAEIQVRHGLGLGDCFAAALALMTGSPLLTGDADFLPLAEHGLKIEWVGGERP